MVINWKRHRPKKIRCVTDILPPLSHAQTLLFWQWVQLLDKKKLPSGFDLKVSVHVLDEVKVYKNPDGEAL